MEATGNQDAQHVTDAVALSYAVNVIKSMVNPVKGASKLKWRALRVSDSQSRLSSILGKMHTLCPGVELTYLDIEMFQLRSFTDQLAQG